MHNQTSNRASIMVDLLDSDQLLQAARESYTGEDKSFQLYSPCVIADALKTTGTIRAAVINTEGVGNFLHKDGHVDIYVAWWHGYVQPITINADVILDLWTEAVYNKSQVDLADHIRVFGDRLEDNFSLWASRIQAARGLLYVS